MRRFEIFSVDLNPTIGAEMNKVRPCVIISPDEMNAYLKTVMIAPLTSVERNLPTRVFVKATPLNGLRTDSYIVLDQIKTVDKLRLAQTPTGVLSQAEQQQVSSILCQLFAI